jgi:hypothetical protein
MAKIIPGTTRDDDENEEKTEDETKTKSEMSRPPMARQAVATATPRTSVPSSAIGPQVDTHTHI